MAGINQKWEFGPPTRQVSATVKGGELLEADGTTGKVKPSTAGAVRIVGVAGNDAIVEASADTTTSYGAEGIDVSRPSDYTTTLRGYVPVKYVDAANFGDPVKAAAAGQVAKYVVATDNANLIVGRCEEPAGVAAAATGVTLIF